MSEIMSIDNIFCHDNEYDITMTSLIDNSLPESVCRTYLQIALCGFCVILGKALPITVDLVNKARQIKIVSGKMIDL